jgi:hypothetical protein
MKKIYWIIIGIMVLLMLSIFVIGCVGSSLITVPIITNSSTTTTTMKPVTPTNPKTNPYQGSDDELSPVKGIVLYNAVVNGSNINAGNKGEFGVALANQTSNDIIINVTFAKPDNLRDGYSYIGDDAVNWISVNPSLLDIPANNTGTAVVTIDIPKEIVLPEGKLEFWLCYSYNTGGFLNYNLNQRWLLSR